MKKNILCFISGIVIFQTFKHDMALAHVVQTSGNMFSNDRLLVLLIGNEQSNFYDDLKIEVSNDKVVKQVGVYQYVSKNEMQRTVPAVTIKAK